MMMRKKLSAGRAASLLLMLLVLAGSVFAVKTDAYAAAVPAKVTAKLQSSSASQITIKWNNVSGESGYKIYRRVPDGKYAVIKRVKANVTKYTDKTVQSAVVYDYAVRACGADKSGNTVEGAYKAVRAAANPVGVKASPAVQLTDGSVKVTWKAAARAEGYRLWRKIKGGKWKALKSLNASTLEYTDSTGTLGSSYQYCVRAYIRQGSKRVYGALVKSKTVIPIKDHTANLDADKQQFIKDIAKWVKKYAKSYGIRVYSPVIAQAIHESGWGESKLSAKYHNYFGLKCGTSWTGKSVNLLTQEEYKPGTMTTIRDNFRVYKNMSAGVKGYFQFIDQLSRYHNLKGITDPKKYLKTIKADGYATDSKYVSSVYKVITTYNLIKYDP